MRSCQEGDVSGPVRIAMLGLSRVQQDNGKRYMESQNVCKDARIICKKKRRVVLLDTMVT
jgi:hypothetical protein